MLCAIERVAGERGEGCPWHAMRDPFVQAVISAHRHWSKGELDAPRSLPKALLRGVEIFDAALNAVQSFDIKNRPEPEAPEPTRGRARVTREPAHAGRRRKR